MTLLCMSFLWIGSQIPLFLFGSVIPLMYNDIGGVDRWVWFVIGYLIPNAALCPFVGALSDLFGRQKVAIVGQVCLILGPIITATAHSMNIAIGERTKAGREASYTDFVQLATFSPELALVLTSLLRLLEPRRSCPSRTVASTSALLSCPFCPSALRYSTLSSLLRQATGVTMASSSASGTSSVCYFASSVTMTPPALLQSTLRPTY